MTNPKNPPLANGDSKPKKDSDLELEVAAEVRRDEAEDLRLEARLDGKKDVDREARIDELESAGDLVEAASSEKRNLVVADLVAASHVPIDLTSLELTEKFNLGVGDVPTGKHVPTGFTSLQWARKTAGKDAEKGKNSWYRKSGRVQGRELQKIMGTYRPHKNDPKPKKKSRNGVRNNGSLSDYHESPKVRQRITEADGLLKVEKPKRSKVPTAPPLPATIGYCHYCTGPIPEDMRDDSKFCTGAHRTAFFRRKALRDKANKEAFKDCANADTAAGFSWIPGLEIPYYYPAPAEPTGPPLSARQAILTNRVAEFMRGRRSVLLAA
jgi:hypothetical protein